MVGHDDIEQIGPLYRLSVAQHQEIARKGILAAHDPVELLEGLLLQKMKKTPPHVWASMNVGRQIERFLPSGFHVRLGQPITLKDGEPEPDCTVVSGTIYEYDTAHPLADDTKLIVEVADSSLLRDRGIKLRSYARAGIAEYWIINLIDSQIETYIDPDTQAVPHPTYKSRAVCLPGSIVSFTIGSTLFEFNVSDLLRPT